MWKCLFLRERSGNGFFWWERAQFDSCPWRIWGLLMIQCNNIDVILDLSGNINASLKGGQMARWLWPHSCIDQWLMPGQHQGNWNICNIHTNVWISRRYLHSYDRIAIHQILENLLCNLSASHFLPELTRGWNECSLHDLIIQHRNHPIFGFMQNLKILCHSRVIWDGILKWCSVAPGSQSFTVHYIMTSATRFSTDNGNVPCGCDRKFLFTFLFTCCFCCHCTTCTSNWLHIDVYLCVDVCITLM